MTDLELWKEIKDTLDSYCAVEKHGHCPTYDNNAIAEYNIFLGENLIGKVGCSNCGYNEMVADELLKVFQDKDCPASPVLVRLAEEVRAK